MFCHFLSAFVLQTVGLLILLYLCLKFVTLILTTIHVVFLEAVTHSQIVQKSLRIPTLLNYHLKAFVFLSVTSCFNLKFLP